MTSACWVGLTDRRWRRAPATNPAPDDLVRPNSNRVAGVRVE